MSALGPFISHDALRQFFASWWFQIFFIFTTTWGNDPIGLIFFKWVETTNQFEVDLFLLLKPRNSREFSFVSTHQAFMVCVLT